MKTKLCIWSCKESTFEFDAISKTDEMQKVRIFAKANNIKVEDMKKGNE